MPGIVIGLVRGGSGRGRGVELRHVRRVERDAETAERELGDAVAQREVDAFDVGAAEVDDRRGDAPDLAGVGPARVAADQRAVRREACGAEVEHRLRVRGRDVVLDVDAPRVGAQRDARQPVRVVDDAEVVRAAVFGA
jgi:hypothetical protein